MVAFNKDCGKIAVANEGEGVYGATGLVDPEGSVSIISLDNDGLSGTVQTVKCPVSSAAIKRRQWQPRGLAGLKARRGCLERSGAVAQLEERAVVCLCGTSTTRCGRQLGRDSAVTAPRP